MPGGTTCCVSICKMNSKKAKEMGENLIFFSFPRDPKIRKEWVRKCYRKDKFKPDYKRICSKHFKADDYEDALRSRLMGCQPKRLKKNATPSLHLLPNSKSEFTSSERAKRAKRKEHKALVEEMLTCYNEPKSKSKTTITKEEDLKPKMCKPFSLNTDDLTHNVLPGHKIKEEEHPPLQFTSPVQLEFVSVEELGIQIESEVLYDIKSEPKLQLKSEELDIKCETMSDHEEQTFEEPPTSKLIQCKLCNFKSTSRSNVLNHIKTHTPKISFKCIICDYVTVGKRDMELHVKIHTGGKLYKCNQCEYRCIIVEK